MPRWAGLSMIGSCFAAAMMSVTSFLGVAPVQAAPVPCVSGPKAHRVVGASSTDGLHWTLDRKAVAMQASVPDALATPSGDVLLIYVDASGIPETAGMRRLSDGGKTFTTVDFTITGLPPGAKVLDPNLVRLSDGRIRLYFYANPIGTPVDSQVEHTIASAISQDGVHFTYEGAVFAATGLVDPDVFQVGDAWLMYVFARGGTMVAHSTDGRAFVADGLLSPRNVGTTGPVHLADGRWRLYGFVQPDGAIVTYISRDDARTWEPEQGFRLKLPKGTTATDPQVVQLGAKRWRMYLKLAEADRSCMKPPPS